MSLPYLVKWVCWVYQHSSSLITALVITSHLQRASQSARGLSWECVQPCTHVRPSGFPALCQSFSKTLMAISFPRFFFSVLCVFFCLPQLIWLLHVPGMLKLLWPTFFPANALVLRLLSLSELWVRYNKSSDWGFPRWLPNRSESNNSLVMALFQELQNHFVPSVTTRLQVPTTAVVLLVFLVPWRQGGDGNGKVKAQWSSLFLLRCNHFSWITLPGLLHAFD